MTTLGIGVVTKDFCRHSFAVSPFTVDGNRLTADFP